MTAAGALVEGVRAGDRRALARAITLVESTRADHRADADEVLSALLPQTGGATRVGITGAPGAGKSTFIETLGLAIVAAGHRLAVLAVDPSSVHSGGSILGDKTRMERLSREADAFIRPSPAGSTTGGVARRTREALLVCEAAGFDVVLVETVGVGQAEVAVADMVDSFVLLAAPGGGDDLQGIKRGVMELADLLVVTKADGELLAPAQRAAADYRVALHLVPRRLPEWDPPVLLCSALHGDGVGEVWDAIEARQRLLEANGALEARREQQAVAWMWKEVRERLVELLHHDGEVETLLPELEECVRDGTIAPTTAARRILDAFARRAVAET